MPLTIGSNIASLLAQRRLGQTSSALETVFERLASGQRINRASDDAAGLAIADGLRTDARIFNQASRNINDGMSMLNIAGAAMSELSGIVQRIQELAEQAANGVYSSTQRASLDQEAQALANEYRRILSTTEFNDMKLLDGSTPRVSIQVGLDGSSTSRIDIDLGVANSSVWDGTFTQVGEFGVVGRTGEVHLADFNGDGNLDMMSHSDSGGQVTVLQGDGSGNFVALTSFGGSGHSDLVGDFDNDGDADIFTQYGGQYNIALNNGAGSFTINLVDAGTTAEVGKAMIDINGDNNLDVAYVLTDDTTLVYFGNGNGTFAAALTQPLSITNISTASFADVNEDGAADIIYGQNTNDEIYLAFGNGDGTFGAANTLATVYPNSADVQLADANNDGHLDIFVTNYTGSSRTYPRLGNGDGTFGGEITVTSESFNGSAQTIDLNSDGNLDLVRADQGSGTVYTYLGNGDGSFQTAVTFSVTAASARTPSFGDVNNDGVTDIAVPTWTENAVNVLIGGATEGGSFPTISLLTQGGARDTLEAMRRLGENLALGQARMGASVSRLQAAGKYALQAREQYLSAESRIRDADIAAESAELIRLRILQNAAAAVLSNANLQPKLALQLLES